MDSIVAENVKKFYKKFADKHKFLTLKSAFLDRSLFSSMAKEEAFEALKGLTFSIPKGKTVSVIGENGSGKSTLLKLLAGISQPTEGKLEIDGRVSALIELGAGFHPEISGRENIYINGVILGLSRKEIQKRYQEIVRFAELEDFIENPVKTYSSGMYMRLGFSIAINVDPDILLIDEVLSVGDASFVPKCLDRIMEFKRKGKTIIFVSHDLGSVEKISDEVIWIKDGNIEMRGYPKKVVDAYLEYVGKKDTEKAAQRHKEEVKGATDDKRWGSKEIEISNVRMIDAKGKEKYIYDFDEPLSVEFDVTARTEEKDFVFGIGVFNTEGVHCYGSNTYIEDFRSKSIRGKGRVKVNVPALNLINGSYYLDVAVHKRDGYPFDYHHFLYSFKVTSKHKDVGIGRISHNWEFTNNIELKKYEIL